MATYTPDSLRNLFQSSFNLAQWYSFLQHFFNASELKEKPERIIENTSDEGYYLGNIDTTDSYRIGLFQYNIVKGSVANKRVGLRNLVKSFINPTWGEFDAALVVFDSGDHWRLSFICDIKGTTDLCVQTMHTHRIRPPDLRQKRCPLPYIYCRTTDRQTSDPQRFSVL